MTFKKLLMIPLLLALPAFTGCSGGDCKSLCEDRNDCAGVEKVDCSATCDESEKLAEDADCKDQYDDFLDCADGEDVCKVDNTACSKESSAYISCILTYCTAHSTAAGCS